jgi:hypothetical protein
MKRSIRQVLGFCFFVSASLQAAPESPTLIGGRPADPTEWPASVYASMGNSRCTATVVGKRVIFIAAHCVANNGQASFTVGPNAYAARCTHSADYRNNATADYALCLVSRDVTGIQFENVSQDLSILDVGDQITLTGYGCVRAGGGGGNDGIYRIGNASIQRLPQGNSNDIVTSGGAALCFGDSGGPAFKYLDGARTKRVLISINSRGDIRTTSYLSSVATTQAKRFINAYIAANRGVEICGVTPGAQGCRPLGEAPDPTNCASELMDATAKKELFDVAYQKVVTCVRAL